MAGHRLGERQQHRAQVLERALRLLHDEGHEGAVLYGDGRVEPFDGTPVTGTCRVVRFAREPADHR